MNANQNKMRLIILIIAVLILLSLGAWMIFGTKIGSSVSTGGNIGNSTTGLKAPGTTPGTVTKSVATTTPIAVEKFPCLPQVPNTQTYNNGNLGKDPVTGKFVAAYTGTTTKITLKEVNDPFIACIITKGYSVKSSETKTTATESKYVYNNAAGDTIYWLGEIISGKVSVSEVYYSSIKL